MKVIYTSTRIKNKDCLQNSVNATDKKLLLLSNTSKNSKIKYVAKKGIICWSKCFFIIGKLVVMIKG